MATNTFIPEEGTPCLICGKTLLLSFDQEYQRCIYCGVVRTQFQYNSEIYDKSYADTYTQYAESEINTPLNLFRLGLISRWLKPEQRILDVGCCIGEFIRFAERYYDCVGFEPNLHAAEKAKRRTHSPIVQNLNGSISKVQCITMFDVLEHVQNPHTFLGTLSTEYLLPNGIIAITTPNVSAVPNTSPSKPNLFLKKWKHYKPKEHLFLYTRTGLEHLFRDVHLNPIHWGFEESDIRPGNPKGDILTCVVRKYD